MASITLIGSGNTATALGMALRGTGHTITQVWSRTEDNARKLGQLLDCPFTTNIGSIDRSSDFYLITVKDDAIAEVAKMLPHTDKVIAHTSGIKSKDLLQPAGDNYGIFYPNVSMTKGIPVDMKPVLMMIEGANNTTVSKLKALADSITANAKIVEEKQRQSLHVASVFANNFTNYMYITAEKILKEQGLDFDSIRPMIAVHLKNLLNQSPELLQTGPGVRSDQGAIDSHLQLLAEDSVDKEIYILITKAIQEWRKGKA